MSLADRIVALGGTAHWPLGESAGDALDVIGTNDGSVTVGGGSRSSDNLNFEGDGSLNYDGLTTITTVPDDVAIQNNWDGGGTFFGLFRAGSDGEISFGRVWDKAEAADVNKNVLFVHAESAGNVSLRMIVEWSTDSMDFKTDVNIPTFADIAVVITYNADTPGNTPIFYIHDGTSLTTRTDGDGLTRTGTEETGTRTTDVGHDLIVGNAASVGVTWFGLLDEFAFFNGVTLTEKQAISLINLAISGLQVTAGLNLGAQPIQQRWKTVAY